MRYMGGKSRLAKGIRDTILQRTPGTDVTYYEPFVGGCGSFEIIAPRFARSVGSDLHEDLILMWSAVTSGWEPPTEVTPAQYEKLKAEPPQCGTRVCWVWGSFGGKWFGGYARGGHTSSGDPRNHQAESARNVKKTQKALEGCTVEFRHTGYTGVSPQPGDVVYCDPPYRGTTEYRDSGFNSDSFWEWATELSRKGVYVFVSEYEAPEGWVEVFRKTLVSSVSKADKRKDAVDRLFQFKG